MFLASLISHNLLFRITVGYEHFCPSLCRNLVSNQILTVCIMAKRKWSEASQVAKKQRICFDMRVMRIVASLQRVLTVRGSQEARMALTVSALCHAARTTTEAAI